MNFLYFPSYCSVLNSYNGERDAYLESHSFELTMFYYQTISKSDGIL